MLADQRFDFLPCKSADPGREARQREALEALFGPRAPTAAEVQRYDWWRRRRLSVEPGPFTLWHGAGRGQMAFDRWVELDLAHVDSDALAAEADRLARTLGGPVRNVGL